MLPLILKECPAEATDPLRLRRQWSWERDSEKKEWTDTAYWDCLFIAAMYLEKQGPPPDTDTGESTLRTHLEKVIGEVRKAQAAVEAALH
jgi:hypothetical protein